MGIDVLGLLTQAQCAAAAALVKCERKYGTRYCAAKYSNTWGNRQYYDEINNMPFDTVGGPIDLDWFMDIGSLTGGSYGPQDFMDPGTAAADNAAYGFGKALWQIIGPPEVLPHYDDWKERQTMWLRFLGYRTFRDLFPSKFLKEECCIDRTWGDWVRDNFDYWYNPFK